MEGSLFLVKRRGAPRFRLIILNKKSAENFSEDVSGGFNCELNKPYLIYRNKAGGVVGIWFYEEADCDRLAALLQKISSTFAAPSDAPAGTAAQQPSAEASVQPAAAPAPVSVTSHPVQVSASSAAPSPAAFGASDANEDDGIFWDRKVMVPEEITMPGIPAPSSHSASGAPAQPNTLAKVFAGMKVAAPPAAPAAVPASQTPVPLLTPQFLQQAQQAKQAPPPPPAAAREGGNLLSMLQANGSRAAAAPAAASPSAGSVASLLRALAENETFCSELANEMRRAGFGVLG